MQNVNMPIAPSISFLRDTKSIGDISEMAVALALARAGYLVAKPIGENCRYDLIIDKAGVLSRVQVKTGRLKNGVIEWHCCSTHFNSGRPINKSYIDQIEFFGIYCPRLQSTYLVPITETVQRASLRVFPTKNNQTMRIRWAKDYLVSSEPLPNLVVGARLVDGVTEPGSPPS